MSQIALRHGGNSSTEPLRDVLVHRPGPAFGAAFDDPAHGFLHPVDLAVAQREHDAFTEASWRTWLLAAARRSASSTCPTGADRPSWCTSCRSSRR